MVLFIAKYINQQKKNVIKGDIRVKELAEYLDMLKAPKKVQISEDGSGIVSTVLFDVATNQLIGFYS